METGRWRLPAWRGRGGDVVVTVVTALIVIGWPVVVSGPGEISVAGWGLMLLTSGALYVRRDYPVLVAVVTLIASAVYLVMPDPDGPIVVAFAVALYTLVAEGKFVAALLIGAVAVVGTFYGESRSENSNLDDVGLLFFVGWLVSVMAIGGAVYNRRAYLREADQRVRDAERGREEELRRRTTEERLRIARELHDVLGHTISLINVQASAALHRMPKNPEQATDALSTIKDSSHEALQELRATLGVLRQVDEDAPTAPAPSLSRVPELIERSGGGDLAIEVKIDGEPRGPLPPAVDLAGYRIVQEALTNVTRHSGATSAMVRVSYGADDVRLDITDDGGASGAGGTVAGGGGAGLGGPGDDGVVVVDDDDQALRGDSAIGSGSGIVGMKERAASVGGELTAGPNPAGGFRVQARLPIGGRA